MLVPCECGTTYKYNEEQFGGAEKKSVTCPKCNRTIELTNPRSMNTKVHREVLETGFRQLETPKFSLTIMRGLSAGRVLTLEKERTTIGRSGADIEINDPEASRIHAELQISGDTLLIRDLGSSNGVLIKGKKIDTAVLDDGGEFEIGQTLFEVHKVLISFD